MRHTPKSFQLSPEIHAYLVQHGTRSDAIQQELIEETQRLGRSAGCRQARDANRRMASSQAANSCDRMGRPRSRNDRGDAGAECSTASNVRRRTRSQPHRRRSAQTHEGWRLSRTIRAQRNGDASCAR